MSTTENNSLARTLADVVNKGSSENHFTRVNFALFCFLLSFEIHLVHRYSSSALNDSREHSEASVIHLLTGWIPEPIPLK